MLSKLRKTTLLTLMTLLIIYVIECVGVTNKNSMGYEEHISISVEDAKEIVTFKEVSKYFDFDEVTGVGTGEFSTPLSGRFTSGYGQRWGRLHGGIDIAAKTGTPIKASDNGKVIFAGNCGSYGLLVKIDHQNGYVTYYAHCSKINVSVGDVVRKGEIISFVGNTGNSTGPHCHFEVRYNNNPQNPRNYLTI